MMAFFLNIIAVFYAVKQKLENWVISIMAVIPLLVIFYEKKLYGQFSVQIFFLVYSLYGLYDWDKHRKSKNTTIVYIREFDDKFFFTKFFIITIGSAIVLNKFGMPSWVLLDYLIVFYSIIATFLLAKRYIENWYLWLVVDICSIALFFHSKLELIGILYLILLGLAMEGLGQWSKDLKNQESIKL